MEKELQGFRQANGEPYELVPLPWPDAVYAEDGQRLPATYANFLIINGAVLLPVYGVPQDDEADPHHGNLFSRAADHSDQLPPFNRAAWQPALRDHADPRGSRMVRLSEMPDHDQKTAP